jgi:hypothetical protein
MTDTVRRGVARRRRSWFASFPPLRSRGTITAREDPIAVRLSRSWDCQSWTRLAGPAWLY